jgi:hypothetical protein
MRMYIFMYSRYQSRFADNMFIIIGYYTQYALGQKSKSIMMQTKIHFVM